MNIGKSVSFIFEDENWLGRIAPLSLLTLASFIPLLGIFALVFVLGYLYLLARDVRDGIQNPLPEWKNFAEIGQVGGQLLLVMVLYNLPLLILFGCIWTIYVGIGAGFILSSITVLTLCCTFPSLLIYTFMSWSSLAVATARYMDTNDFGVYFRPVKTWDVLTSNTALVRRWAVQATIANLLIIIGLIIPVIGWLFVMVFAVPMHGHLLGQFARRLNIQAKIVRPDDDM